MENQDVCIHSVVHRQHTLSGPTGIAGAHWEVKKHHFMAVLYHKLLGSHKVNAQFALISSGDTTSFKMPWSRMCFTLSHRKKYSISSQRKHLENKWKRSDILTLCLPWTLARVGWEGCALWKQCITEDKIIWRNVIWDFKVEEKAVPQFSVSFLEMFSMTWKGKQSCPQRSWKAKGNIFLMKRAVLFLNFPSLAWFYVNQFWVLDTKSSISERFCLMWNICLFFNNKVLQMLNLSAKSYLIQHYITQ